MLFRKNLNNNILSALNTNVIKHFVLCIKYSTRMYIKLKVKPRW